MAVNATMGDPARVSTRHTPEWKSGIPAFNERAFGLPDSVLQPAQRFSTGPRRWRWLDDSLECVFRGKPSTYSDRSRPLIPIQVDQ